MVNPQVQVWDSLHIGYHVVIGGTLLFYKKIALVGHEICGLNTVSLSVHYFV